MSADSSIPYERPPLSKGFLAGKTQKLASSLTRDDFYRKHEIEVQLNCVVDGVDPGRKTIHLRSGAEIGFEKLVVATGAQVRKLNIPGADLLVSTICALLKTRNVFVKRPEARSGQSSLEAGSLRWK